MPTVRSTKKEIWDAYQALADQLREKQTRQREVKEEAAFPAEEAAPVKLPDLLSVERVVDDIAQLKLRISGALNNLTDQLTHEVGRLQDTQAAISREKEELERLYRIKAEANTLLDLLELHEAKKATLAKEAAEAEERFTLEVEQKKRLWGREGEEYDYALIFKRKKESDEYEFKRQQRERAFLEQTAQREKAITEREAKFAEKEAESEALRQKAEAFPEELERNLNQMREKLREELTLQARATAELKAKDAERERELAQLKIQSLEEAVKNQSHYVERLETQLGQATQKAQELALKIIEARRGGESKATDDAPQVAEAREEKKT